VAMGVALSAVAGCSRQVAVVVGSGKAMERGEGPGLHARVCVCVCVCEGGREAWGVVSAPACACVSQQREEVGRGFGRLHRFFFSLSTFLPTALTRRRRRRIKQVTHGRVGPQGEGDRGRAS